MEYLVLATRKGVVKKTKFTDYNTPLKSEGIIAINLREDDELVEAFLSSGDNDLLMVSARPGDPVPREGSASDGACHRGVRGMSLRAGDEVIAAMVAQDDADLLVVTEQGYGKRTPIRDYPRKGRGGLGVKTVQLTEAKGQLAGARSSARATRSC